MNKRLFIGIVFTSLLSNGVILSDQQATTLEQPKEELPYHVFEQEQYSSKYLYIYFSTAATILAAPYASYIPPLIQAIRRGKLLPQIFQVIKNYGESQKNAHHLPPPQLKDRIKSSVYSHSACLAADITARYFCNKNIDRYFFEQFLAGSLIRTSLQFLLKRMLAYCMIGKNPRQADLAKFDTMCTQLLFLYDLVDLRIRFELTCTNFLLTNIHKYGYHLRNYITGTPSLQSKETVASSHQTDQELAYE